MKLLRNASASLFVTVIAMVLFVATGRLSAGQEIVMDNDDISGVVRSPNGPEGGVWVIAETDEFMRLILRRKPGQSIGLSLSEKDGSNPRKGKIKLAPLK